MIISIDVDAQKTFTPLCPAELPVAGGDAIAADHRSGIERTGGLGGSAGNDQRRTQPAGKMACG